MSESEEKDYPFIPITGHSPLIKRDELPKKLVLMENGSHQPHFAKEEMIDTSPVIERGTALCGREAKQLCTDNNYKPSIGYTCSDCLKKLNSILKPCLYDSEEEVYYHPVRDL